MREFFSRVFGSLNWFIGLSLSVNVLGIFQVVQLDCLVHWIVPSHLRLYEMRIFWNFIYNRLRKSLSISVLVMEWANVLVFDCDFRELWSINDIDFLFNDYSFTWCFENVLRIFLCWMLKSTRPLHTFLNTVLLHACSHAWSGLTLFFCYVRKVIGATTAFNKRYCVTVGSLFINRDSILFFICL